MGGGGWLWSATRWIGECFFSAGFGLCQGGTFRKRDARACVSDTWAAAVVAAPCVQHEISERKRGRLELAR